VRWPAHYQIIDPSKVGSDLDVVVTPIGGAPSRAQMRFTVVFLRRFAQNADGRAANDAQPLRIMRKQEQLVVNDFAAVTI